MGIEHRTLITHQSAGRRHQRKNKPSEIVDNEKSLARGRMTLRSFQSRIGGPRVWWSKSH